MGISIHVDGGSRGNPGPAGAGVVIRDDDGRLLHESAWFLGHQTNNAAEYLALLRALERAARLGPHALTIHSDSELLVRQLTGQYQVRNPRLAQLHEQVQLLLLKVARWSVRHVAREENRRADELANLAMERGTNLILFDVDHAANPDAPAASRPAPATTAAPSAGAASAATSSAGEAPVAAPLRPGPGRLVRVTVSRPPAAHACPAGGPCGALTAAQDGLTIGSVLPAGLCLHAAHALLPTLLAIQGTDPAEFAAVPTMTVRCSGPGCGAEFQLTPERGSNGHETPRSEA